jgi:pyruvate dehydrogenase E2 component (dihydrolipoamide acetyltransferase)
VAKIDVTVPDIGDFKDVPIIEVLVKEGDIVKVDQSLITFESDKATMDVPSPAAGKIAAVVAKVGDKVSMGTLIARMDSAGEATQTAAAAAKADASSVPAKAAPAPAGAKTIDVAIPDIGDFKDVPVIEILVKEGDTVEAEQPLMTLESDKATMDVPSPAAGKVALARVCTPRGSTSRTSRRRTKRTSRISKPSARRSMRRRRKTSQNLIAFLCCHS